MSFSLSHLINYLQHITRVKMAQDPPLYLFLLFKEMFIRVSMLYDAVFLLYCKVIRLYVYMYLLFFFGFPSHLIHHRALSQAPCAKQ